MYEEQWVTCKFGEVLSCAGTNYYPPIIIIVVGLAGGVLGVLLWAWINYLEGEAKEKIAIGVAKALERRSKRK